MKRTLTTTLLVFLLGLSVPACSQPEQPGSEASSSEPTNVNDASSSEDASTVEEVAEPTRPPVVRWDMPKPPKLSGSLVSEFPWLQEASSWFSPGCGKDQPSEARKMGDYAVGNGYSFSLAGYACPIHTLHAMVGPTYQKDGGFFADTWMEFKVEQKPLPTQKAYILRARKTPILLTHEDMGKLVVQTVTWAPKATTTSLLQKHVILRIVQIQNVTKQAISSITLKLHSANDKLKNRQRTLLVLEPKASVAGESPELKLGSIEAGTSKRVILAFVMTVGETSLPEIQKELAATSPAKLLTQTHSSWQTWLGKATQLSTPDVRVNDLYTGMLVTTLVQRTWNGAVSPMSRYTNFWTRDIVGPTKLWLQAGLWDEAKELLQFYGKAASAKGVLANSYSLRLPEPPPSPPDWSKLPALKGRTAAEAPSYLSLMHSWYRRTTGDSSLLQSNYPMLLHSVLGQQIDANQQLPFSGDETFRVAMSMTLGLTLEHKYEECCASTNSSLLFVAAAEALAQESRLLGKESNATTLMQKASEVRKATESLYWKQGYYLPFLDRSTPKEYEPYPDISTKALWAGYHQPDDAQAIQHVREMVKRTGQPDGMWQLPTAEQYKNYLGFGLEKGIYTGMTPGYVLSNLTMTEHPSATALFNTLPRIVSSSGNIAEYQVYSDHSAFQFLYDKSGRQSGDTTARFRPWEGGILIAAMMQHLLGFESSPQQDRLTLAPRLPNHWPKVEWKNIRFRDASFNLVVTDQDSTRTFQLTTSAAKPINILLRIPLEEKELISVTVNGQKLPKDKVQVWQPFGWKQIQIPEQAFSKTQPLNIEVQYQ